MNIHIISFTIPYPANYGGVIDIFYKIKSLYKAGIKIHLHCFLYDRQQQPELEKYCSSVNYYPRPIRKKDFFSALPFIVKSRSDSELLNHLEQDNYPILIEGLHSSFFINELLKNPRNIIIRTHNIEHEYYRELAKSERKITNKIFFYSESFKLKKYQRILKSGIKIAAISPNDYLYFKNLNEQTQYIPAFHPYNTIQIKPGKGDYILYHGNLSVNENILAAKYIINNICPHIDFPFIISGLNPDKSIVKLAGKLKNVEIIPNPDDDKLNELIQNAHINLLITFQDTGIKLKLINALYNGRYCVTNAMMVENTGLENLCLIANNPKDIGLKINELLKKPFNEEDIQNREQTLLKNVNNEHNTQKLINLLQLNK